MRGVVINDIHFGIKDSKRVYEELGQLKSFLIQHSDEIQVVLIAGDYYDRKLSVTEPATFYAMCFFQELLEICREKKFKLRMIQGTRSHELNQLSIFEPFMQEKDVDFKIIYTVQEEVFSTGFNVLYLPEEYPEDSNEYYKDFKQKEYSAIIGHGTWDFVSFDSQIKLAETVGIHSAPVFKFDEWENSVKNGFISFGHIHSRNKYKNKIFYCGSFSRWGFGERSARGFTYFNYDEDNKKYDVHFIDNVEAPLYDVIEILDLMPEANQSEVSDICKLVEEYLGKTDFLRVGISGLDNDKQLLLKEYFQENKNLKFEGTQTKIQLNESTELSERAKKFAYIIERKLPLAQVIERFAKEELLSELELKKIKEIIEEEDDGTESIEQSGENCESKELPDSRRDTNF